MKDSKRDINVPRVALTHIAKVYTRIRLVDVPCEHIRDVSRVNASNQDVNVPRVALTHIAKVYIRIRVEDVFRVHIRDLNTSKRDVNVPRVAQDTNYVALSGPYAFARQDETR